MRPHELNPYRVVELLDEGRATWRAALAKVKSTEAEAMCYDRIKWHSDLINGIREFLNPGEAAL